jgi:hypothetical protein
MNRDPALPRDAECSGLEPMLSGGDPYLRMLANLRQCRFPPPPDFDRETVRWIAARVAAGEPLDAFCRHRIEWMHYRFRRQIGNRATRSWRLARAAAGLG